MIGDWLRRRRARRWLRGQLAAVEDEERRRARPWRGLYGPGVVILDPHGDPHRLPPPASIVIDDRPIPKRPRTPRPTETSLRREEPPDPFRVDL